MISKETGYRPGHRQENLPVVRGEVSEDDRVRNDVWALMDTWAAVRGTIVLAGRSEKTMTIGERRALKYWEDKIETKQLEMKWILGGYDEMMSFRDFLNTRGEIIEGSFSDNQQIPNAVSEPVGPFSPFTSLAERLFCSVMQRVGIATREHPLP